MKLTKKILPVAMSALMAAPLWLGTTAAQAEVSATLGAANMYLWRGQNLTPNEPQFHGSLDYSHASGFYAGAWMTNEGVAGSYETDLYLGYGGSFGDFGYDVSYWKYLYPSASGSVSDTDLSDFVLGLSYGPVSFTAYLGAESGSTKDDYYTIAGDIGDFNILYGLYEGDGSNSGQDYSHFQVSYAFNDNITFTASKASNDGASVDTDPLFVVSYVKTFDM